MVATWVTPSNAALELARAFGHTTTEQAMLTIMRRGARGMLGTTCGTFDYAGRQGKTTSSGELSRDGAAKLWRAIEGGSLEADWSTGDFQFHYYFDRLGFITGVVIDLRVNLADVQSIVAATIASDDQASAPVPILKRAGRPSKYDWPAAIAALLDHDSLNDVVMPVVTGERSQSELENYVLDWFAKRGQAPAESLVRRHVAGVVQHRREKAGPLGQK